MPWLYLALCISITGLLFSCWLWWTKSSGAEARRISSRLALSAEQPLLAEKQTDPARALRRFRPEEDSMLDSRLSPWMYQAGLKMRRPRHYLLLHLYLTFSLALILYLARGVDAIWTAVMLSSVVMPAAAVYLLSERKRRLIEAQLPELIDGMVAALQAGHTLNTLWMDLARHVSPPLNDAVVQMEKRLSFGESMDGALQAWSKRTTSADLRFFIAALRIQYQSGGNPIELLKTQAALLREKLEMQSSLHAATSEARLSAWILALIPILAAMVFAIFSPDQFGLLLSDSRGQGLLRVAIALEAAGVLWLLFLLRSRS